MDALSPYFALNDIPGHVSYAFLAVSYCLTDIYWLRVTAVVALAFEIMYFSMTSSHLYAGIGWDLIFIAINGYHLAILTHDRFSLKLGTGERQLLTSALKGLCDAQLARVLRTGTWREIAEGTRLMAEGQPVGDLYFIQNGRMTVHVKGNPCGRTWAGCAGRRNRLSDRQCRDRDGDGGRYREAHRFQS